MKDDVNKFTGKLKRHYTLILKRLKAIKGYLMFLLKIQINDVMIDYQMPTLRKNC